MRLRYHRSITAQAIAAQVSSAALEAIIAANFRQDALRFQFGHDHFHYDGNAFEAGDEFVAAQRRSLAEALVHGEAPAAWRAFGKMSHSLQDFYSHSNYVGLWRERNPEAGPEQIQPVLDDIMADPRLESGRLYYPLEALSFIPLIRPLVKPFLPRNSHAWMNKDDPSCVDFDFAFAAAVKRTELEFQNIVRGLIPAQATLFRGKVVNG